MRNSKAKMPQQQPSSSSPSPFSPSSFSSPFSLQSAFLPSLRPPKPLLLPLLPPQFFSFLFLLLISSSHFARISSAKTCFPSSSSSIEVRRGRGGAAMDWQGGGGSSAANTLKQCPDFKDEPEQTACCPSQITNGAFFCCTEEHKDELEAELAAEARRQFLSGHIPELVLTVLALLLLLLLACSCLCRRTRFCPLLHRRKANGVGGGSGGSVASGINPFGGVGGSITLHGRSSTYCCAPPPLLLPDQIADLSAVASGDDFNNCRSTTTNPHFQHRHQIRRPFARPYHHQIAAQQSLSCQQALFTPEKECEAPPPYSFAIATSALPLHCGNESRQNRLNMQREQQQQVEGIETTPARLVGEESEEEQRINNSSTQ